MRFSLGSIDLSISTAAHFSGSAMILFFCFAFRIRCVGDRYRAASLCPESVRSPHSLLLADGIVKVEGRIAELVAAQFLFCCILDSLTACMQTAKTATQQRAMLTQLVHDILVWI